MSQTKVKSGLLNFPDQTDFVKLPSGTTAQRPSSPEKGYSRYNTTDNKLEFWNGTVWQQLPGVVAPIITSISYPGDDLAADPAGGQTITITGTDFKSGATVTVDGITPYVITFVSDTEITFTSPAKVAGDYDIVVTNVDGGNATAVDGMTYNGLPSWTTPAGNLGTFAAGSTIPTITLVATEPDSGTVSYSVTTGALPSGLALTGADIDGTVPFPAGETTYNFSVTASDDENQESTERAFNIVVYLQVTNTVSEVDPFGDSSGVALYQFNGDLTDVSTNWDLSASGVNYPSGAFGQAVAGNKIPNPSWGMQTSSQITISWWGRSTNGSAASWGYLGQAGDNPVITLGNASVRFEGNGSQIDHFFTAPAVGTNWNHYAITIDCSTGFINHYTNSEQLLVNADAGSSTLIGNLSGYGFFAGSSNTYSGSNVELDQVRVFDRALTPLEIESLYRERTVVCGGQADTLDILGDNSCIATYQLNGNANDLSGNYSGTPTNVSYGVGEFDLAGVFNGSSSYITTPLSLSNSGAFSFSVCVNPTLHTGYILNTSTGADVSRGINFLTVNDNRLTSKFHNLSNDYFALEGTYVENTWNHVVVTFDNTTNTNGAKMYVNGSVVDQQTSTGINNFTHNTNIALGKPLEGGVDFLYDGSIDQVRIFNKALNQAEVATLYNETACDALACSGTTNTLDILSDGSCVAAYPLDGSPVDLSGNYNGVQTDVTYPVGKFDLGASFNGSSSSIDSGYSLPASSDSSFSFWFKTSNTSTKFLSTQGVVTGSANQLSIAIVSSGTRLEIQVGNSYIDFAGTITNDAWHNFVFSRNASSGYTLYLDGSFLGTFSNTTALQSANLFLGTRSDNTSLTFDGQIDQVRIFNKALSAGEVTTLYNETACN